MKTNGLTLLFFIFTLTVACSTKRNKEKEREVNSKDSLSEYVGPNYKHYKQFSNYNFTTEKQWDSLNNVFEYPKHSSNDVVHKDYKTFGWHLYSKGSAYKNYNFSLLWGISYFSYIVNPETGSYKNIHQWKTTALIDSAKVKNCKVFLSVSNFGARDNTIFLNNPNAQKTLIDSLSSLLTYRGASGVNIDFEGIHSKSKKKFSDFIILLSKELRKKNPGHMVSVALYAVDYNTIFDIKLINPYVDFYTLMAYDYYGGFSKNAGPVSPLRSSEVWGRNSIESSVEYYLKEGVESKKLIVGLPYYGAKWQTDNVPIPSKVEKFLAHEEYSSTKELLDLNKYPTSFDTISSTQYSVYEENGVMNQLWFDDSLSLSHKYDWVKSKKLSGVGIWALGYDHGDTELWVLLANKFGQKK
ncbi:glycosyl hydrolase family 18 protein [Aquimarina sediminis]|uniref:glycosyl hydrolase family 18 protein n=1 Tax=Aquimarina sediminis TaxID=2070536 RepID=UPI000CA08FDF|nr:glycosyl hydrolase family 18 protein [Aquimarina sediminis]